MNKHCGNYTEIRDKKGKLISITCDEGMDMTFCSENCAYVRKTKRQRPTEYWEQKGEKP